MNKKSDVDILIEQCIQDVKNEYLEEGFVDNIKAGFNGAKECLKADAHNSFKLGKKNDIKNDRKWSARKGKVASYAKSIANTMQDFKKQGGTLGRGMKVDDVISRLNQVAQGKYPRGKALTAQQTQQNQSTQPQETQTTEQPQTTKPTSTLVQKQGVQKSQPVQQKTNSDSQQAPAQTPASTNISSSTNSEAQNKMLSSIGSNVPQETTATSESRPAEQKTPKLKSPELDQKVGKALTSGDKKLGDAVRNGYKGLKDKMAAAKDKKKVQHVNPEVVEPEIVENPVDSTKQPTSSAALGPVKQQTSPGGRPMKTAKARVVDAEPVNEPLEPQKSAEEAQNSNPQLALPTPAPKKKLTNAEKAKQAISKAQADIKKARANAPKLNIPGTGKPVKRRRIVSAKQRKDIDTASKEMEDFHKGLGDTGAEWEETIHESYYDSNTSSQLKMLNSIR